MHPSALRILAAIRRAARGLTAHQLAERLGLDPRRTSRWLKRLEDTGALRRGERNGEVRWRPVADGGMGPAPGRDGSETSASSPGGRESGLLEEEKPSLSDGEAIVEASRCLECGTSEVAAPCMAACPTGIDVPRFVAQIAEGRPDAAAETILSANPLGGTCARVCPVEDLCEGACVLAEGGRGAIRIGRLQRYATDHAFGREAPDEYPLYVTSSYGEVGVIGAGPAGLACADELARSDVGVTVYEKRSAPGGLIRRAIAPYKQHISPLPDEVERIVREGVRFEFDTTVGDDLDREMLEERHRAIFLAAGMGGDIRPDIPGSGLRGVSASLSWIERVKLGHGYDLEGDRVVVVGGGNTAVDVAREAARLGARSVTVLYRRTREQMPAYEHEVAWAREEGVRFRWLAQPVRLVGGDSVRAVKCRRMELGEPDASGRPRLRPIPDAHFYLGADRVVMAVGQQGRSPLLTHLEVEREGGRPLLAGAYRTRKEGYFAGGDVKNGGATVVEAVRDGRWAARAIRRYLDGRSEEVALAVGGEGQTHRTYRSGEEVLPARNGPSLRTYPPFCKGCDLCVESCPVDILSLDERDRIVVEDGEKCIFCGLCEERCPDFAIWLADERSPGGGDASYSSRRAFS